MKKPDDGKASSVRLCDQLSIIRCSLKYFHFCLGILDQSYHVVLGMILL